MGDGIGIKVFHKSGVPAVEKCQSKVFCDTSFSA